MPTKVIHQQKIGHINTQHWFLLPTTGKERLLIWQKAQEAWNAKGLKKMSLKQINKELKILRNSWERKLPKLT